MQLLFSENISGTVRFYLEAKHVPGEGKNSWEKALSKTDNFLPPKRIRLGNEFKNLDKLSNYIRTLLVSEEFCYVIPLTTCGGIVRGFIFRLEEKKQFRRVDDGRPVFYGLHRFEKFKYGGWIILSEGIKDAEAIARFYPYSLAVLGSHISTEQSKIINCLSSRFIFVGDNDKSSVGVRGLNKKAGAIVVNPPVKDVGMYFENQGTMVTMFVEYLIKTYIKGGIER